MTSAFHDPEQVESELREGWSEAVLEELVIHALGGEWGVPADEDLPSGHVRVSVLRGTEFREWDDERGRTAAERAVTRASLERRVLQPGDLVIEISGGGPDQPVGRSLLIDEQAVKQARHPLICSNFCRQIRLHPDVDPAYVALVLRHRYERGDFNAWQSQTTNIRNLDFRAFLAGVTLPVPPLAEQRRIVAQATELLAQARQVWARLAKLPPALKRFRQSVLAHACSGHLTEDWRVRHRERELPRFSDETEWQVPEPLEIPEVPESWTLVALNDLVARVQYGASHRADAKSGMPVLRMSNIQEGRVDMTHMKYIDSNLRGLDAFKLKEGDILFNRTNSPGLVGKAAVYVPGKKDGKEPEDVVFASYLVRLVCDAERMLSQFLCAWINSPWGRQWARTVRRDCVSQSNINSSKLRRMPVPTPPLAEQREIVRWMERLFHFADAVDVRVATAMARAGQLSQAVLDKAFRGDLVPTEAELARLEGRPYEPAWVLLGRVKSAARKPRTGRKSEAAAVLDGPSRRASRNRTVAVWDADQVLVAFRQACWGAGAMNEDELIRRVADRLGVERLGKKVRSRLLAHLVTAVERRIVARRGDRLEGATPTFARYDDEYLLHVVRTVLRGGVEYDLVAVVRSVASYLGYGQVTAAVRNRMEGLLRNAVRRGALGTREGKVWKRG
ncbi:MAG TPA: restriction endonuclease subunit S [Thermoanaerobaculia bacterium]|jgi:type I restriction enzyme S subunit|nr:restriction endonuclease subunit S [Thermoanaerobaculia bacterium]